MNMHDFYTDRIAFYAEKEEICINKEKKYPFIRLAIFVISAIVFYLLFAVSVYYSLLTTLIFMFFFFMILKIELKNSIKKNEYNLLKEINKNELLSLDGIIEHLPDGIQYLDHTHAYAYDLDIFGAKSVYQLINRTNFKISSDILSNCLLHPASKEDIKLRQEAIKELSTKIDWRQKINVLGHKIKDKEKDTIGLIKWLKPPYDNFFTKGFVYFCTIISALTLLSIILSSFYLPTFISLFFFGINVIIIFKTKTKVAIAHNSISKNASVLKSYSEIINEIEKESFSSTKLIQLKETLKAGNINASQSIKKLSSIVANLDIRYMQIVHFFLNTFLFWDIHQLYRLENWRKDNVNLEQWFESVGEFEVLSSFANIYFNYPDWCTPEISNDYFVMNANNIGHPLINNKEMVVNNFAMNGIGKVIILTGSNMSGKSTFLRTLGVNYILAMAGSNVCASTFKFSPISIISMMRINDSLKDNTSSFHAELKKLSSIIKTIENKEKVFLLLDEILKGTNSIDREIGSKAFIKQLIDNEAVGIIATHDLSLTDMVTTFPENIENYNFNIKIHEEELIFDYKLNKGICNSRNASILMKKMGIKI